jgi:hypothetical protein
MPVGSAEIIYTLKKIIEYLFYSIKTHLWILRLDMVDKSTGRCSHRTWWIIRSTFPNPFRAGLFVLDRSDRPSLPQVRLQVSSSESSFTRSLRHETAPYQACEPLEREAAARDTRAPRVPSIDGWFCRLPLQESGAGSVAPDDCPLARVAA